ncbi:hypothetical protein YC2023_094984 [Brassica napus]
MVLRSERELPSMNKDQPGRFRHKGLVKGNNYLSGSCYYWQAQTCSLDSLVDSAEESLSRRSTVTCSRVKVKSSSKKSKAIKEPRGKGRT